MKKLSKIINQQTKEVCIAVSDNPDTAYFQKSGFIEQEVEDTGNGRFYLAGFAPTKPQPSNEEIRLLRSRAYAFEVDSLTLEISRLRDEPSTPDIEDEISRLQECRRQKVSEIKQTYPYNA